MPSTPAAVSAFPPSFREWQEELAMERMMTGFVKLVVGAPAVMTLAKIVALAGLVP